MKKNSPIDFQSQTKVSNEIQCNSLKTSYFYVGQYKVQTFPIIEILRDSRKCFFLLYLLPFTPQRHPYHQQCPSHALPVHGDLFPANRFTVALNEDLSSAARVVYHCLGDTNTCGNRNGWGLKVVWNFPENSSVLVTPPIPKYLFHIHKLKTHCASIYPHLYTKKKLNFVMFLQQHILRPEIVG